MADEKKSGEKTIEMRLAELEDKVSKIHITEEELKAYHKVNALIGGQQVTGAGAHLDPTVAASPLVCVIQPCVIQHRVVPRIVPRIVNECTCGPCFGGSGGGGFGGGGFGGGGFGGGGFGGFGGG
jgi:hypothetical protein